MKFQNPCHSPQHLAPALGADRCSVPARTNGPAALARAATALRDRGFDVTRARLTAEGEIVIDFATSAGEAADPFELVDLRR